MTGFPSDQVRWVSHKERAEELLGTAQVGPPWIPARPAEERPLILAGAQVEATLAVADALERLLNMLERGR